MIQRPIQFNAFEFAVLAGRRASQLSRGCLPRVSGSDKVAVTAQMEVAEGKVTRAPDVVVVKEPGASRTPDTVHAAAIPMAASTLTEPALTSERERGA